MYLYIIIGGLCIAARELLTGIIMGDITFPKEKDQLKDVTGGS
jgi:hypothetical protein